MVYRAFYSIANYGKPSAPQGLYYSTIMCGGAHTNLSMYMGIFCPIRVSKRSHPVRQYVPRDPVSWHVTLCSSLAG
jgi:hypothetical protein